MKEPIIEFQGRIYEEEFETGTFLEAGSYIPQKDSLKVDIRIWNNRSGTEDVQNLSNFAVGIFFKEIEDQSLLKYIKVYLNEKNELPVTISDNMLIASFIDDIVLKGSSNNGLEENVDNYIDITIRFDIKDDINIKDYDIKTMYVELIDQI